MSIRTTITVIGCGVDDRFIPPADPDEARRPARGRLPQLRIPVLLYVGGFQPQKNVEGLLDAYASLDPALRSEHQLVVGRQRARRSAGRVGRLGWLRSASADRGACSPGLVADETLVRLYQTTRLLVFPSLHEGFGLPVAEAAACGAPAISSNTSSLPEVIGWEPSTFDPTDPEAIAAAIERALGDEQFDRDLRTACRAATTRHRWDRVVDAAARGERRTRRCRAGEGRGAAPAPGGRRP